MSTKQHLRKFIKRVIEERARDQRQDLTPDELQQIFEAGGSTLTKEELVKIIAFMAVNIESMPVMLERFSKEEITLLKAKNSQ